MNFRLQETVVALACIGTRVSGLIAFMPILGSNAITPRIKAGLVVLITAVLYPLHRAAEFPFTIPSLLRVMVSETFVGALMGLTVHFTFEAAQFAGQLIGMQVGFSLVNMLDPNTQVETPVISVFTQTFVTLLFLQMNVHHWVLRAIARSFSYLPPGCGGTSESLIHELLHAACGIWVAGVQIAAPILVATMLADIVLGFLGKASPQLPVLFLGLSLKSMVGLTVLALSMKYWPPMFERAFTNSVHSAERLLHLAH
jgi:flagellar biosynthetic protein FliR